MRNDATAHRARVIKRDGRCELRASRTLTPQSVHPRRTEREKTGLKIYRNYRDE